jgi:hypothetical protein
MKAVPSNMLTTMGTPRQRLVVVVVVAAGLVVGGLIVLRPSAPSATSLGCDAGSDPDGVPSAAVGAGDPVNLHESWADDVTLPEPGSGFFNAVASSDDRAVAVGRVEGEAPSALIALSDDGRTWRVASDDGPRFRSAEAVDAVAADGGFVVAGSMSTDDRGGSAGAIWWSETGEGWEQQPPQPIAYIHQVASGSRGLLATASTAEGDPALGSSADGRQWRWTPWPTMGSPSDVASIDSGWIAVGSIGVSGDDRVPVVWRSQDGTEWTCQVLATTSNEPFGNAVAAYPGRMTTLVRGHINASCWPFSSCAASDAVWVATADGAWQRIDREDAPRVSAVTVASDGSFVVLTDRGVSRSVDGTSWRDISDQVPAGGAPTSIGVARWGLVAVGGTYQGAAVAPYITLLPAE